MELFDEDFMVNEKTDNKKTTTIILVLIIFLIVMILLVTGAMIYIKETTLKVTLNGQESSTIRNMIRIDEENPKNVYVPIRKIASLLGYSDYSGNYLTKSEEMNECYVECENEVSMFTLSSNIIYKTLKDGKSNYEYFNIVKEDKEAVKSIDGEMYTTIDGIEKAFNVSWNYDIENNRMDIYTMPKLVEIYTPRVQNLGYERISEDFTNQKALLKGMIIAEKENSGSKSVAVIDAESEKAILEAKYENIQYLEHTNDFLVTSDGKKGIISNTKKTTVRLIYDDIQLMDYDKQLYLVKKDNRYGIIDFYGKTILNTDYTQIGIDNSNFKENEIKSKYILADTLIPIKNNQLWGFFDIKGNQITDFKYDAVGYTTSNNRANSGYNLLVVPEYNVIVVGYKDKYTVIYTDGEEAWPMACDSIYMSISGGNTSYLFEFNGGTYSVTNQIDSLGRGKSSNNTNQQENEQENENENEQENENQQENENSNEQENENVNEQENQQENENGENQTEEEYNQ